MITGSVSVLGVDIQSGYTGTITQNSGAAITVGASNFAQAAGTFVGGDAAITVNGSFGVSAGSFTSTRGTLTAATGFSVGGTFNANGGTVQLFTAAAQTATLSLPVGQPLNNLIVGGNFATNTLTVSAELTVNGTLILASSSAGAPATINGSRINVKGDIIQGAAGSKGTSALRANGTAQTLYGGGSASSFPVFENASAALTLSGTIATGSSWTNSGGLDPGTSTVQLGTASNQSLLITGSMTLNNVTVGGNFSFLAISLSPGTTLTTNGTLLFNTNVGAGGGLTVDGGTLVAKGDVIQGQATANCGVLGTTPLVIAGTGNQTLYGTPCTGLFVYFLALTIDKPSGTLFLSGQITTQKSWTYVRGALAAGTSGVHFVSKVGAPISVTGSHKLNKVRFYGEGGAVTTLGNTTTLTVGGFLVLETAASAFTLNGGTVEAQAHITMINGGGGSITGTAKFLLSGSADQIWKSGASAGVPSSVTIDKPAGTVYVINPLDFPSQLNIVSGILDINNTITAVDINVGAIGVWRHRGAGYIHLAGNVINNGVIDMRRMTCNGVDNLELRSKVAGQQRLWSGSGAFYLQDLNVSDMGGSAAIIAYSSTKGSNVGDNWTFNGGCGVTTLTSPTHNEMFAAPATISLAATPGDAAPAARIEFYRNGALIATDTSDPYTFSDVNVGPGTYTYSAISYDVDGTPRASNTVTVSVSAATAQSVNVALQANGGVASASQVLSNSVINYLQGVNSGDRYTTTAGNYWTTGPGADAPAWLQINFSGPKTIGEVDLFMYQSGTAAPPTPSMLSYSYVLKDFQVQYLDGTNWVDLPNAHIRDNINVWCRLAFPAVETSAIRVLAHYSAYTSYVLAEVEAWTVEASVTPAGVVGGFNAFDKATAEAALVGNIKTKIAATAFELAMIALNADKSAITSFTGEVKVELLDASGGGALDANRCNSSWPVIRTLANASFAATGRVSASFVENDAWPNARVRVSYPASGAATAVGCSNDNFAIRPSALAVTAKDADWQSAGLARTLNNGSARNGVVHKAGQPFTIIAAAPALATRYAGNPTVKTLACLLPNGCENGALTLGAYAGSGTRTAAATYSEAGTFGLELEDKTFASVDAADSSLEERTISQAGGAITVGRFVPDHFELASLTAPVLQTFGSACATRSFTYLGQPFGYATLPQATHIARNASGATTVNYSGALWPADVSATATYAYTANPLAPTTLEVLAAAAPTVTSVGVGAARGSATLTGSALDKLRLVRPSNTPIKPSSAAIDLSLEAADASEAGVAGNGTITTQSPLVFANIGFDAGNDFRFGVMHLANAYGSDLLDLPVPVEARYWDGIRLATNVADHCTRVPTSAIAMASFKGELAACETAIADATATLENGRSIVRLANPGAGNSGSVDLMLRLAASSPAGLACTSVNGAPTPATDAGLAWLQGRWSGASYSEDPVARASFGQSRARYIFRRESY